MITVTRRSFIEGTTPEDVFTALADPQQIGRLLPRVRKVDILDLDMEARTGRLVTYMSLGGIFGTLRCEGELTWVEPSEILFKVESPVPVETKWLLSRAVNGTDLEASMNLDLTPMLGAMASFVPVHTVSSILDKELESALVAIGERINDSPEREQAVAA